MPKWREDSDYEKIMYKVKSTLKKVHFYNRVKNAWLTKIIIIIVDVQWEKIRLKRRGKGEKHKSFHIIHEIYVNKKLKGKK